MRSTVAICTHNRSNLLTATVCSVVAEADEVLIVDNASTDGTAAVAAELAAAHANVRCVHEAALGLSHARNRALAEARGDVVVFLDDDAVAAPGLVAAHLAAYVDESVGATGGRIELDWPRGARPWWLPAALDGMYAALDLDAEGGDRDLRPQEGPYGANMSVLRDLGRQLGFDPLLGRQGTSLLSNEETQFFVRLRRTHAVRYAPAAKVAHRVIPSRAKVFYVIRRSFAAGQSEIVASRIEGETIKLFPLFASLAANLTRLLTARGAGHWGPRGAIAGLAWSAEDLGRLRALASARPRDATPPESS